MTNTATAIRQAAAISASVTGSEISFFMVVVSVGLLAPIPVPSPSAGRGDGGEGAPRHWNGNGGYSHCQRSPRGWPLASVVSAYSVFSGRYHLAWPSRSA